jgi:hypothetical protein
VTVIPVLRLQQLRIGYEASRWRAITLIVSRGEATRNRGAARQTTLRTPYSVRMCKETAIAKEADRFD